MNRFQTIQTQINESPEISFGGRFSDLIPAEDRGFVSNIVESWKRGDEQILSDIAIYEAMQSGENLEDALNLRRKYLRKEVIDPVEGNLISNLVYKGIKILPGWFQSAKSAIPMTVTGAVVGGAIPAIAGAAIPLPEEIATVPAGILTGAKTGFTLGSSLFWYKQGAGGMFADMIDKGYDPDKSWAVARIAAIPYAALEFMQLKAATPAFKKGLQGVINKSSQHVMVQLGKTYLSKLGQQVGEEVAQEAVQIVAEDVAGYASGMGVDFDADAFKERVGRLASVAWESAQAMALLPVPGSVIETAVKYPIQKAYDQMKSEESKARWEGMQGETYGEEPPMFYPPFTPPAGEPPTQAEVGGTMPISKMSLSEFELAARRGKIHKATGVELPGEREAKTPIKFGLINKYSTDDIARFYAERRGFGEIETTKEYSPIEEGYKEFIQDAIFEEQNQQQEGYAHEGYFGAESTGGYTVPHIGSSVPVQILHNGKIVELDYSRDGRERDGLIPSDPLGKLQFALMKSVAKYREMKLIHKEELADKFSKAESAMMDNPTAREGLKKARGKMAGVLTELKIEPIESLLSGSDWESIFSEIRETERLSTAEKLNLSEALEKLIKDGTLLRPHEIGYFGKQFGPLMEQVMQSLSDLAKKPTKMQRFLDILGIPKALSASMDISRTFRQNILLIGNPEVFWKGAMDEWKLFYGDEKYAREAMKNAMTDEYAHIQRRTGLRMNEYGETGTYATKAENFPTKHLSKVPWVGRSERAYVVGGNLIRIYLFNQIAKEWENDTTRKYSQKDYNDLAHYINVLTGEGDARMFGDNAGIMNAAFFAPRLAVSRFQAIFGTFNWNRSWAARKVLARHMVRFVGVNTILLSLASFLPGATVDIDPLATDFGKVRFGNTRVDFWGGYQPMVRMIFELAIKQHTTQTGQTIDVKRYETIMRFLQAKLAPVPATILDYWRGETFYGQEVAKDTDSMLNEMYSRLTPFVFQDLVDAVRYSGIGAGAGAAPLAFVGIGVQSYDQTPGTKVALMKDRMSQEVFGKRWSDMGSEAQKILREYFPEIETEESKLNYEYQSPKYVQKIIQDEYASEKRILGGLGRSIATQLAESKVHIGGLSKRIGSDWYLTKDRFSEYEQLTTESLKRILPLVFKLPEFDRLLFTDKQLVLGDVIAEVKNEIREHIVQKANYKDLEYLYEQR